MTLYRATYVRGGMLVGVSFSAETNEEADCFVAFWERTCKVEVLTVKAVRSLTVQPDLLVLEMQ